MYQEIIEKIKLEHPDKNRLLKIKQQYSKKHKSNIPRDSDVYISASEKDKKLIKQFTLTKPIRTLSGVAPISLFPIPMKCAHGTCIFCPGGPGSHFGDVPQSYTGNEPASRRAKRNNYNAYLQIFNRLEQYHVNNHSPEKVEIIIQGGTFPTYPLEYQEQFLTSIYKSLNDFSTIFYDKKFNNKKFKEFFELPADLKNEERTKRVQEKILSLEIKSNLEKEQKINETSKIRAIAVVVETKPDWCLSNHIDQMLKLGTTRVEVGVQSVYNDILKFNNRGHTIEDTKKSFQLLKDSFLKVTAHMMLGLPKSDREKDIYSFKEIFTNQDFLPDSIKIYPCLVMPGTPLYRLWERKEFTPITTEQAADIISEIKKFIPKWTRVMRVNRDIPTNFTTSGVDRTNLRQYVDIKLKERGIKCNCIRCREPMQKEISWNNIKLNKIQYQSSNGTEVFLSIDDMKNDLILGFCRLRIPFKPFRKEITNNSAGIRELHIYGSLTQLNEIGNVQHKGLGKQLLQEAEKISKEEFDCKKLLVISGIGVKQYYKNLGFKYDGYYMSKQLTI